jgi:diguanylate cyclase (GGDEF)-like protein
VRRTLAAAFLVLQPLASLAAEAATPVSFFEESPWPGEASFEAYGPGDELMSMGITGLTQDKDGYVWVATDLGLYWFDGNRFHSISAAEGLAISPGSRIWADPRGGVWASTVGGLFRVQDHRVVPVSGSRGLPATRGANMSWDEDDHTFVAMADGALFREGPDGTFTLVPVGRKVATLGFARQRQGIVLVDDTGRVAILKDTALEEAGKLEEPGQVDPVSCLEDGEGRLWILTRQGLWFRGLADRDFHRFTHPLAASGGDYRALCADGDGGLWSATAHGLLHIRGRAWTAVTDRQGMPTKSAALVLVDHEGALWYASNGLFRQKGLGAWSTYTTRDGLPTEIVWALQRDGKGRLWGGTNLGLVVLAGEQWRQVPGSENVAVFSIVTLPSGAILASGRPKTLLYVPAGKTEAQALPDPMTPDPGTHLLRMVKDVRGDPWVISVHELCHLAEKPGGIKVVERISLPDSLELRTVFSAVGTSDGALWMVTRNGLVRFHEGRWRSWTTKDGLRANGLYGLAQLPDGSFLVSYYGSEGVTRLRVEGDTLSVVRHYSADRGELPTNSVFSVHVDVSGRVWLMTEKGAVLLRDDGYRSFGTSYGMHSQDMVNNSFFSDPDGTLWFGNANGLARFDSAHFPWSRGPSAPTIEDLRFGGKSVSALSSVPIEVEPEDNSLEASLGLLSYHLANAYLWEVKIDGLDAAWRREKFSTLHYLALPPGQFALRVRAVVDGKPGPELVRGFRILPRWYQQWWFGALVLLGAVGIVAATARWRSRRLRQVNERLEAEVQARTRELKEAYERLEELSVTDPLTTLHNRRFLEMIMPRQIAAIAREMGTTPAAPTPPGLDHHPLAFLLVDIDHFKTVNDEHGHAAGDAVLRQVAAVLRSCIRDADSLVRWGGEEFLVMARFPATCDPATMAERLRASVEARELELPGGRRIRRTVSIGFAVFPLGQGLPLVPWEVAVTLADRALYATKRSGRNGWTGLFEGEAFDPVPLAASGASPDVASLLERDVLRGVSRFPKIAPDAWG